MKQLQFFMVMCTMLPGCMPSEQGNNTELKLYPQGLSFGDHKVGYRTIWTHDITRPAVPYSDWNGRLYGTTDR